MTFAEALELARGAVRTWNRRGAVGMQRLPVEEALVPFDDSTDRWSLSECCWDAVWGRGCEGDEEAAEAAQVFELARAAVAGRPGSDGDDL